MRPFSLDGEILLLTIAGDLDVVAKLAGLAIYFDTIMKELLKGRAVEQAVIGRAGEVDGKLVLCTGRLGGSGLGL